MSRRLRWVARTRPPGHWALLAVALGWAAVGAIVLALVLRPARLPDWEGCPVVPEFVESSVPDSRAEVAGLLERLNLERRDGYPWSAEEDDPAALGRPLPPPGGGDWDMRASFSGAVRAAAYVDLTSGRSVLAVAGGDQTIYSDLKAVWASRIRITPYDDGRGLFLLVEGERTGSPRWFGFFRAVEPDWRAELVLSIPRRGFDADVRMAGRSRDGALIWVHAYSYDGAFPEQMLEYNVETGERRVVGAGGEESVLPSPDDRYLALDRWVGIIPTACEASDYSYHVEVIDLESGRQHVITPTGPGFPLCFPVGWSKTQPSVLYFMDEQDNLWRVDVAEAVRRLEEGAGPGKASA